MADPVNICATAECFLRDLEAARNQLERSQETVWDAKSVLSVYYLSCDLECLCQQAAMTPDEDRQNALLMAARARLAKMQDLLRGNRSMQTP